MHNKINTEKLSIFRRRLAAEADLAARAMLTRLLEKQVERGAMAIQKKIDKRDRALH
jgi:hypothetical protein